MIARSQLNAIASDDFIHICFVCSACERAQPPWTTVTEITVTIIVTVGHGPMAGWRSSPTAMAAIFAFF